MLSSYAFDQKRISDGFRELRLDEASVSHQANNYCPASSQKIVRCEFGIYIGGLLGPEN
jgi:hypothetical protein